MFRKQIHIFSMMNGRSDFMLLLTASIIIHHEVDSKWMEGVLDSKSNWEFLTRFCFLTQNGALDYEFRYPVEYGTQEVLLYYDEPGQWNFIYRPGKTCTEKLSVLSIASNQIIALNTSNTETSLYSGCELISHQGDTWYSCQGQRGFRSTRERWWYMAISRCGDPKGRVNGLYLQYKIHMTNGDDLLHREFSADEFYILPVDIFFFIAYLIMVLLSVICAAVLRKKNLFHTTYKLYLAALFIWTFHLLLMVIAWGYYGNTGLEMAPVEVTGRILQAASKAILILMLILMAKGYTITRGRLTRSSTIKMTVFFIVYVVTIIVLFVWEGMFFDAGKVLYYYESPPGYGMVAMHFIAWLWFLYATAFTIKNSKTKVAFYIPFLGFYTLWFLAGPMVILIAMFAMAKWSREKTVNGVEQFVSFMGHVVFLVLTRPSAANSNFPYHVRTSQIAALASNEDNINNTSNPYVVSTMVTFSGSGPNLELFITSKTARQANIIDSIHLYNPLASSSSPADTSRTNCPQVMNDMVLPSCTVDISHRGDYNNGNNDTNENFTGDASLPPIIPLAHSEDIVYSIDHKPPSPPPGQAQSPPDYVELFPAG